MLAVLTAVADWTTESITVDFRKGLEVLAVSGDYRACDPGPLRRALAEYTGLAREDVFANHNLLVIVAPLGTFAAPATYRAWVDAGVSEAERDTMAMVEAMRQSARIVAENVTSLAAEAGLSPDAIMRAAMVAPETADAIMSGEALPDAALVRIATALGVPVEALPSPDATWT